MKRPSIARLLEIRSSPWLMQTKAVKELIAEVDALNRELVDLQDSALTLPAEQGEHIDVNHQG